MSHLIFHSRDEDGGFSVNTFSTLFNTSWVKIPQYSCFSAHIFICPFWVMQPKCQPDGNSKNYDHLWLATKMPAGQRSAPEERMTPITLLLLCLTSGLSRGRPGPQNQAPEVSPSKGEWPLLLCFCFAWSLTSPEVTLTPKIGLYSVWPLASPEVALVLKIRLLR